MKTLTLKCEERATASKSKPRFLYKIYHDENFLCMRSSDRLYVACYVRLVGDKYDAPFFFSRLDLIGKGASTGFGNKPECYGLALRDTLGSLQAFNDSLKQNFQIQKPASDGNE